MGVLQNTKLKIHFAITKNPLFRIVDSLKNLILFQIQNPIFVFTFKDIIFFKTFGV